MTQTATPPMAHGSEPRIAAGDGTWTVNLPGPQERSRHAAVYDSQRNRMIMFGGRCQDPCCADGPVPDDVWMLMLDSDTPRWVQVRPTGTSPGLNLGPAAIYDPVRKRMLVPGSSGQVWELALANAPQWNKLSLIGTGPSPTVPTAVYDPVRDQMIVVTSTGTWTLALAGGTQWTQLATAGTTPIGLGSAIYDPIRDRVVVFADSVRALSLSGTPTWTVVTNNSMPRSHSAIYDPVRDRVVLHGGCVGVDCGFTETWAFSLSGPPVWTQLLVNGPLVSYQSAVYDPSHDRMVVFGGYGKQIYYYWSSRELWTLSFASMQWKEQTPPNPPRACSIPAVRDPARSRAIVFDDSVRVMGLGGLPTWNALAATGPTPRQEFSAIVDPQRDRMMLFGGWVWSGNTKQQLTDLWTLSLSSPETWASAIASGTPPASSRPAVHDPLRDRMLVIGTQNIWALALAAPMAWSAIVPSGTPPPVDSGYIAVHDAAHDRVLVFGGGGAGGLVNDVWELVLAPAPAWNHLAPSGTPPAPRVNAIAAIDPGRNRMVISGGMFNDGTVATDTWAMTLSPSPAWTQLTTGGATPSGVTGFYDPSFDRLVTVGTCAIATLPDCHDPDPGVNELWFGGVVDVPRQALGRLSLAQNRPNPMRGTATIAFTLARPDHVSLRVYDLSGRLIRTLVDGGLPAGDHAVPWDGLRSDGGVAMPGAYFYELETAGQRLTRRLVLLQ